MCGGVQTPNMCMPFHSCCCIRYHDGYLSVHYASQKFGITGKELTPLQQEAIW